MIETISIRARAATALLFCLAALAGCGSNQPSEIHLHGQFTIAGQGPLAKGATARISLIQHEGDNKDDRIVAERTLHDLGTLPVSFTIAVGRQLLGPDEHYAMNAQILDRAGNVRWETRVPQIIAPADQDKPTMLMLQPHDLRATGDFQPYHCADDFEFDMARNDQRAVLHMGNRKISLDARALDNGQGAVYADKHDDQLTFGHDKITLVMDGTTHMDCVAAKASGRTDKAAES